MAGKLGGCLTLMLGAAIIGIVASNLGGAGSNNVPPVAPAHSGGATILPAAQKQPSVKQPNDAVTYNFGNAIKNEQLQYLIVNTEDCLRNGQLALLQQGDQSRKNLLATSAQWCSSGLYNFLVDQEKRPKSEVDGLIMMLAKQQLEQNLSEGQ